MITIKVILIIIAAICKAAADTVAHHPRTSRLKGKFWDIKVKGKFFPFTKYPVDGWHLCNSAMIVLLIVAGCLTGFRWYVDIPVLGIVFTVVFNLFYNKILQKK